MVLHWSSDYLPCGVHDVGCGLVAHGFPEVLRCYKRVSRALRSRLKGVAVLAVVKRSAASHVRVSSVLNTS